MLIYHPVHDINHSLFRTLMILEVSKAEEIGLELFRLIDFYTIFPHLIKEIKPFPNELKDYKKELKLIPVPYERIGNTKRIMFELESVQTTALQNLIAKGFIEIDAFNNKKVRRTSSDLPEAIMSEISHSDIANSAWFEMLVNKLFEIDVKGKSGLKSRTGLMEYRYDMEKV
tara:strand:+ start:1638 stop:2153 length:516 start_codon:yes stop_codon:yes gene_type:complete